MTNPPTALRRRAEQMRHTWDSNEGDQWINDALDAIDEMVSACETALAVGEIQFKTCALSAGAHDKIVAALAKVRGQ